MENSKIKDKCTLSNSGIIGISFDSRKDLTRTLVQDKYGQLHPRLVREEHISVTTEPNGSFLGHVTPDPAALPDKPAKKAAEAIYQLLKENNISDKCIVLGGDSTASNTGWKGGTMAHLEKLLGHKCFWAICMLHTNELPLRHLIE